jgi:hypothetical protein
MAKEIIKQIDEFPDYYVSNKGIFYTTRISPRYNPKGEMRELKTRKHVSGYLYVGFYFGKGGLKNRKWRRAHRVVAETFLGSIPKGKEVNHKDMDKWNNKIANLEYMTRSENQLHWRRKLNRLKK